MPVHAPGPTLARNLPLRAGRAARHARRPLAGLNLTALVDMMTMLVVFLLMTFAASPEITMCGSRRPPKRPLAEHGGGLERAPVLNVTPRGIYLGAGPVAETELEEALRALHAQAVGDLLILSAHRDIDAGVITRVTRAAAAAGFPDVLLAVQQRERR